MDDLISVQFPPSPSFPRNYLEQAMSSAFTVKEMGNVMKAAMARFAAP
jgi:hypothetical protein